MITLFLMFAAGIFKAFMDISAHGKPFWFMDYTKPNGLEKQNYYLDSKNDWWYMGASWKMKYKNNDPSQGEKFLGSTSVFSFACDGWHLFQFFFLNTMIAAIVLYEPMINWWADFLIYSFALKATFELNYKYILVKR